jgi:hypothetical protein
MPKWIFSDRTHTNLIIALKQISSKEDEAQHFVILLRFSKPIVNPLIGLGKSKKQYPFPAGIFLYRYRAGMSDQGTFPLF